MPILDFFLDLIFPPQCVECGRETESAQITACAECVSKVSLHTSLFCGKCRARFAENRKICHKDFPYLLGAAAAYESENSLLPKKLIAALKFKHISRASRPLEEFLSRYLELLSLSFPDNAVVIPIPLSSRRLRTRGYNQSEFLANAVAMHLNRPLDTESLVRKKHTSPQSELDFESRGRNMENAFEVVPGADLKGRYVILVDDVVTSGNTFLAASLALKSAGVRSILALAAAKA